LGLQKVWIDEYKFDLNLNYQADQPSLLKPSARNSALRIQSMHFPNYPLDPNSKYVDSSPYNSAINQQNWLTLPFDESRFYGLGQIMSTQDGCGYTIAGFNIPDSRTSGKSPLNSNWNVSALAPWSTPFYGSGDYVANISLTNKSYCNSKKETVCAADSVSPTSINVTGSSKNQNMSLPISVARVGGLGWNDQSYNHWMPSVIRNNIPAGTAVNTKNYGYFPLLASNFADVPKVVAYSVGSSSTIAGTNYRLNNIYYANGHNPALENPATSFTYPYNDPSKVQGSVYGRCWDGVASNTNLDNSGNPKYSCSSSSTPTGCQCTSNSFIPLDVTAPNPSALLSTVNGTAGLCFGTKSTSTTDRRLFQLRSASVSAIYGWPITSTTSGPNDVSYSPSLVASDYPASAMTAINDVTSSVGAEDYVPGQAGVAATGNGVNFRNCAVKTSTSSTQFGLDAHVYWSEVNAPEDKTGFNNGYTFAVARSDFSTFFKVPVAIWSTGNLIERTNTPDSFVVGLTYNEAVQNRATNAPFTALYAATLSQVWLTINPNDGVSLGNKLPNGVTAVKSLVQWTPLLQIPTPGFTPSVVGFGASNLYLTPSAVRTDVAQPLTSGCPEGSVNCQGNPSVHPFKPSEHRGISMTPQTCSSQAGWRRE